MTLPQAFINRTLQLPDLDFEALEKALSTAPPTSIRVNTKMDYHPSDEKVEWCDTGYYLPERPLFTADPLFHAGVYYVQEASSMFLQQAIKQHFASAATVLDLCAAPGGKSTLLSEALPQSSILVSNEIVRSRAYILAENLVKWGNPNCIVTNNEPKDFAALPGFFDAMVVDAPCSGEGMFRKDPGAIQEWSEYNVKLCAERQREILLSVWDALKTDGILVYSTCTYNREENEDNVQWMCNELNAEVLKLELPENSNIYESENGYRFYPHKTKGEGFFLAVVQKQALVQTAIKRKKEEKKGSKIITKVDVGTLKLLDSQRWTLLPDDNAIKAYDKERIADFLLINKNLKCMHSGLLLGEMKGNDFIPSAAIALSKMLDKSSVQTVEVDYKTAILFLRKEAIFLPNEKRGYLLICYEGQALGWLKNMGNRCNNLYPNEWRIRMKI